MSSCAGRRQRVIQALVGIVLEMALRSLGRCQTPVCPTVRVAAGAALPFEAQDLERLVRMRMRDGTACGCPVVDVGPADGGAIAVSCPDRRAEVSIDGRTGEQAARMVAIVLIDLASAPAEAVPAQTTGRPPAPVLASAPAARPAGSRWSFRLAAGPAWGYSDGAAFEPSAGAGWSPSRRFRVGIDVGFARHSANSPKVAVPAVVDALPLRAGVGLSLSGARLEAGAVLRGYRAHAATSQLGVREGAFAAAGWTFPGWSSLHPYVTAGVDVYTRKLEVRVDELVALTDGTLAPWLAAGLLWSGGAP